MGDVIRIIIKSKAPAKVEPECVHERVQINPLARIVVCEDCGEEVDPDEVMSRLVVRLAEIGYQIHVLRWF